MAFSNGDCFQLVLFTDLWADVTLLPVVLIFFCFDSQKVKTNSHLIYSNEFEDECTFYTVEYDKLFINITSLLGQLQGLKQSFNLNVIFQSRQI